MEEELLQSQSLILICALSLTLLTNGIAWRNGFYQWPGQRSLRDQFRQSPLSSTDPAFIDLCLIFLLFFFLQAILIPLMASAGMALWASEGINFSHPLSSDSDVWINIVSFYVSAPLLWMFAYAREPAFVRSLMRGNALGYTGWTIFSNLLTGMKTWLLAFPMAWALGLAIEMLVEFQFHPPEVDQVAVQLFKKTLGNPPQYIFALIGIIAAVPLSEELVFRGFLQSWLKRKVGVGWAIVGTSILFALLHFSSTHGWHNLELLTTLFLLSCFLGFLFERQKNLWAPIGLHATFNLISVLMISIGHVSEG